MLLPVLGGLDEMTLEIPSSPTFHAAMVLYIAGHCCISLSS